MMSLLTELATSLFAGFYRYPSPDGLRSKGIRISVSLRKTPATSQTLERPLVVPHQTPRFCRTLNHSSSLIGANSALAKISVD
jgi:hypothetical protein